MSCASEQRFSSPDRPSQTARRGCHNTALSQYNPVYHTALSQYNPVHHTNGFFGSRKAVAYLQAQLLASAIVPERVARQLAAEKDLMARVRRRRPPHRVLLVNQRLHPPFVPRGVGSETAAPGLHCPATVGRGCHRRLGPARQSSIVSAAASAA